MDTYFDPELNPNKEINYYIISKQIGDVTGDGVSDEVYLLGTQPSGNNNLHYFDNITLAILDGKLKKTTYLKFKYNEGNNPKLLLSRFTKSPALDIFISIESPSEPGQYIFYLFSALNNNLKSLFNFIAFDEISEYRVIFKEFYTVVVINRRTGQSFSIDIGSRPQSYLNNIYDANGKTKGLIEGDVLSLSYLTPIDINTDGINELLGIQKIVGLSNDDVLGYVQTFMNFNGNEFVPSTVLVAVPGHKQKIPEPIKGKPLKTNRRKMK